MLHSSQRRQGRSHRDDLESSSPSSHRLQAITKAPQFVETASASTAMAHHVSHLSAAPPLCNSCGFRHGPTYTQCSLIQTNEAAIAEPFTADDIEVAINELSPRSTQSISRATMSPMIKCSYQCHRGISSSNDRGRHRSARTEKNYQEPISQT